MKYLKYDFRIKKIKNSKIIIYLKRIKKIVLYENYYCSYFNYSPQKPAVGRTYIQLVSSVGCYRFRQFVVCMYFICT